MRKWPETVLTGESAELMERGNEDRVGTIKWRDSYRDREKIRKWARQFRGPDRNRRSTLQQTGSGGNGSSSSSVGGGGIVSTSSGVNGTSNGASATSSSSSVSLFSCSTYAVHPSESPMDLRSNSPQPSQHHRTPSRSTPSSSSSSSSSSSLSTGGNSPRGSIILRTPPPPSLGSFPAYVSYPSPVLSAASSAAVVSLDRFGSPSLGGFSLPASASPSFSTSPSVRYLPLVLRGHRGPVSRIAFDSSKLLLACDKELRIYSLSQAGRPLGLIRHQHSALITCCDFTPQLIASCAADCTIRTYDWNTYDSKVSTKREGHKNTITSIHIQRKDNSRSIVSVSLDSTVKLWNTSTGQCISTFNKDDQAQLGLLLASEGLDSPDEWITGSTINSSQVGTAGSVGSSSSSVSISSSSSTTNNSNDSSNMNSSSTSSSGINIGRIGLWDLRTPSGVVKSISVGCGLVTSLSYCSSIGSKGTVAAGCSDGSVRIYDVRMMSSPTIVTPPPSWNSNSTISATPPAPTQHIQAVHLDSQRLITCQARNLSCFQSSSSSPAVHTGLPYAYCVSQVSVDQVSQSIAPPTITEKNFSLSQCFHTMKYDCRSDVLALATSDAIVVWNSNKSLNRLEWGNGGDDRTDSWELDDGESDGSEEEWEDASIRSLNSLLAADSNSDGGSVTQGRASSGKFKVTRFCTPPTDRRKRLNGNGNSNATGAAVNMNSNATAGGNGNRSRDRHFHSRSKRSNGGNGGNRSGSNSSGNNSDSDRPPNPNRRSRYLNRSISMESGNVNGTANGGGAASDSDSDRERENEGERRMNNVTSVDEWYAMKGLGRKKGNRKGKERNWNE